jgi:uncharacterized protein (DUF433 family)
MSMDLTDYGDPYVELRHNNLYLRGTRVQFESIILYWKQGYPPEHLHEAFPSVRTAAVYGAIAFYLDHQAEMDNFLAESHAEWERQRAAAEAADPERYPELRRRFAEARARWKQEDNGAPADAGMSTEAGIAPR